MGVNPGASRGAKVSQRPVIVNRAEPTWGESEFNAVQMMASGKVARSRPIRRCIPFAPCLNMGQRSAPLKNGITRQDDKTSEKWRLPVHH